MQASAAGNVVPEKSAGVLRQFDRRRRVKALNLPTTDEQVQLRLRSIAQPVILFGEDRADRRERLADALLELQDQKAKDADGDENMELSESQESEEESVQGNEEEYVKGTDKLLEARQNLARLSIPLSRKKILYQQHECQIPQRTQTKNRREIKEKLNAYELFGSQVVGERPISAAKFAPNEQIVAVGNWNGVVKILNVPNLDTARSFQAHKERIGGIAWLPGATRSDGNVSPDGLNFATTGGDGNVHLWNMTKDTPLAVLSGHTGRVCRTEFHPSGQYLASAGYDMTWRLWDTRTQQELLLQEGHTKEVYCVAFNPEGSLLASGGLDSFGRIWDLRSGRTIMVLEGHMKEIYGMDWSPDGYRVLTGSGDGLTICWDVRQVRESARIPTHARGTTDVKWFKGNDGPLRDLQPANDDKGNMIPKKSGTFVLSGGFDKNVRITSADDWAHVKTLSGHSGNVLAVDYTSDARWIMSAGYDRTVKLWAKDDMTGI